MNRFTILGIDQGLASCGYGIIQFKETKKGIVFEKVLDYGVIKTTTKNTTPERLVYIHEKLTNLVDTYKPKAIACERLFYSSPGKGKRKKSASIITSGLCPIFLQRLLAIHTPTPTPAAIIMPYQ